MKGFLTGVFSFMVHMILPGVVIFSLFRAFPALAPAVSIGFYFLLIGLSIQLTVRLFNMPVWKVRTFYIVRGKEALKYSHIILFAGAVITALSFIIKF
jgi:hypothetical protein